MKAEAKLDPGFICVWNPLAVDAAASLPEPTWRAVHSWNMVYLQKNTVVRVWAERLAVIGQFGKSADAVASTMVS